MKRNDYYGVYDFKESDTFRPTLERRIHKDYPVSKTLCTRDDSCCVIIRGGYSMNELRIRKLTPNECLKLMGVKSKDRRQMMKNQTDSSLYHLAGDSIVSTCLMGIFGELFGVDYQKKIDDVVKDVSK